MGKTRIRGNANVDHLVRSTMVLAAFKSQVTEINGKKFESQIWFRVRSDQTELIRFGSQSKIRDVGCLADAFVQI